MSEAMQYIDVHTHHPQPGVLSLVSIDALDIARRDANISTTKQRENTLFSAGIHPWRANSDHDLIASALSWLERAKFSAIGEIGLDNAREIDKELQQKILKEQLDVASRRELPVVLHCVKAYNDMLKILEEFTLSAVIFHSYIGSPQQTETIIKRGYYISLGEVSLKSAKTVESAIFAPSEKLFTESDDSTTPIAEVYERLSTELGVSSERLAAQIKQNWNKIFK